MLARLVILALCALSFSSAGCASGHKAGGLRANAMPRGGTFTGVWFSPQYGEMHMLQKGDAVIGRYEKEARHGHIEGSAEGDLMRFNWQEQREIIAGHPIKSEGRGYFRIMHDDAEDTWKLIGEWGPEDQLTGGGPWNAVKSRSRRPEL